MRKTKEPLTLKCILTEAETLKFSREMAQAFSEKTDLEAQKKSYTKQIDADIASCDGKISSNGEKIRSGYEFRSVECRIEYDWKNKVRRWIRNDNSEIARDDIIPEEDLQEELKLNPDKVEA